MGSEMDTTIPSERKTAKNTKRAKKRANAGAAAGADSEKRTTVKCDEGKDKLNQGTPHADGDNGQDSAETVAADGAADGCSGDSSNGEPLSMNSVLNLILSQKRKELLECPEVIQFVRQASRDT